MAFLAKFAARSGPLVLLADLSLFLCPSQLSGGCELTVVIHDFTACNSNELTIRRGQTVEVLERPHDKPDWCLVRTTDRSPAAEGLVPCGSLCIAHSRSSMEMEGIFNHKGKPLGRLRERAIGPGLPCSSVCHAVFYASPLLTPSLLCNGDGHPPITKTVTSFPEAVE